MAAFQDTREQTEQKVMVHLLSEIERNPSFTQRGLAGELGIALGLMNQYLKSCITKGWVRASPSFKPIDLLDRTASNASGLKIRIRSSCVDKKNVEAPGSP